MYVHSNTMTPPTVSVFITDNGATIDPQGVTLVLIGLGNDL